MNSADIIQTEQDQDTAGFLPDGIKKYLPRIPTPKSLRSRLVLWNVLVLFLMLITISFVVYELLVQRLMTELDERLRVQATELQTTTQLWSGSGKPYNDAFFSRLTQGVQVDEFTPDSIFIKIVNSESGQTIARSRNLGTERLEINSDDFESALRVKPVLRTIQDSSGRQVRTFTFPLRDESPQPVAVVQVGQSLQVIEQIKTNLITVLVLGSLLAVIIAYGIGQLLTRRELGPIDTLAATMYDLSAQRLQTRLTPKKVQLREIKLLTGAFNQMVERLEASFKLQREFVADVSHELRTPLTAIRGQLDVMLLDPELRPDVRQDILQVNAEVARLSRMVTNLLTDARAEAGMPPKPDTNSPVPVELDMLLIETARQARYLSRKVEVEIVQLQQVSVPGDSDLLKQLLLNLVDNALTYNRAGGKVTLSLSQAARPPSDFASSTTTFDPQEWAVLTVSDTGQGIDPEELPYIFERHYRSKRHNGRYKTGSGLGLCIAKLIAEAHKGYITVTSTPGKGTTFSVWLPTYGKRHNRLASKLLTAQRD
ncbi:MAG TPA: HAMP domain-containing sensor histidine kinase [Chloroflexia bacterium]|nr:HAMP domain-containing sensor histidine kinase [Chloroflexia bacterium]